MWVYEIVGKRARKHFHNEEFCDFYFSPNSTGVNSMRFTRLNCYEISCQKIQEIIIGIT